MQGVDITDFGIGFLIGNTLGFLLCGIIRFLDNYIVVIKKKEKE